MRFGRSHEARGKLLVDRLRLAEAPPPRVPKPDWVLGGKKAPRQGGDAGRSALCGRSNQEHASQAMIAATYT